MRRAPGRRALAGCGAAAAALLFGTATALAQPALLLQASNSAPIAGGPTFTYTATITNGVTAATNLTFVLPLPPSIVFRDVTVVGNAATCQGPAVDSGGTVVCHSSTFPSSATATITVVASTVADTASGARTATARVQSSAGAVTSFVNQSILVSTPLALTLAARPAAIAGDLIVYQLGIANTGPSSAINPTATLTLPAGVRFLGLFGSRALHGSCTANGGGTQVSCAPRTLASGNHALTVVAESFGATPPGTLTATATLTPGTGTVTGSPASAATQLFATLQPTSTALVPSVPTVAENSAVTLSATVTGALPTGGVAFKLLNQPLPGCAAVALSGAGNTRTAICVTPVLADGTYTFTASYAGDTINAPSMGSTQVVVTPVGGLACAGFADVDSGSPFCPNVEWLRNRSVTLGCAATAYCPIDAVNRLAMAAFMNRLGTALSGVPVQVVADSGALDPDAAPVVCATGPITASDFARTALLDGVLAVEGAGAADVLVELVSSPNGTQWTPVATATRASLTPGRTVNARVAGSYEFAVGEAMRFGLRVSRGAGTANVSASQCRLRAIVGNRNAAYSPYDAARP